MKSVTHNGREFLFVEVPEDAHSFELHELTNNPSTNIVLDYWISNRRSDFARTGETYLPPGSYRILCKASEAGEEQARQIVEKVSGWSKELFYGYGVKCSDYRDIVDSAFDTATESLHSLILSLGMEVNRVIILEKVI